MTQKWCSPEVFEQEARGRSADVFSLGCVFLEMYTVLVSDTLDNFSDFRGEGGDSAAFHSSLPRVKYWIDKLRETQIRLTSTSERGYLYEFVLALPPLEFLDLIVKMVERDPKGRPTMLDVVQRMGILTNDIVPILANRMNDYSWRASRWKCCEQEREVYDVAEKDFTWINTFALHRAERNPTDPIQSR
jgi:serine/threonine protein kinase